MTDRVILPKLILSWPAQALWVNRRAHWATKHRAQKAQKNEAWVMALAAGWKRAPADATSVLINLTFCAPTRTSRYDLDGALSACKGALDGLAEGLGVDDSTFIPTLRKGEKCKAGGVIVNATVLASPVMEAVERGHSDNLRPFRSVGEIAAGLVADEISKKRAAE